MTVRGRMLRVVEYYSMTTPKWDRVSSSPSAPAPVSSLYELTFNESFRPAAWSEKEVVGFRGAKNLNADGQQKTSYATFQLHWNTDQRDAKRGRSRGGARPTT